MKILVNISNLTSGGGLTVGIGFCEELLQINDGNEYLVVIPNSNEYKRFKSTPNLKFLLLPNFYYQKIGKLFAEFKIARIAKIEKIDKIVSLTNYALPVSGVEQKLLIHWPYLVYNDDFLWRKMSFLNRMRRILRKWKMKFLLSYATEIIVQTEVMKQRISSITNQKVVVIPAFHNFKTLNELPEKKPSNIIQLLFPSKVYEHKNHEILVELARKIREQSLPIQIFVTISDYDFRRIFKDEHFKNTIINLGELNFEKMESVYPKYDGIIFPTLVETFGIPYIEAMHFGLPIFTSDRDFAKAVCQDYAVYFDPHNAYDIAQKIMAYFSDGKKHESEKPKIASRSLIVKKIISFV